MDKAYPSKIKVFTYICKFRDLGLVLRAYEEDRFQQTRISENKLLNKVFQESGINIKQLSYREYEIYQKDFDKLLEILNNL